MSHYGTYGPPWGQIHAERQAREAKSEAEGLQYAASRDRLYRTFRERLDRLPLSPAPKLIGGYLASWHFNADYSEPGSPHTFDVGTIAETLHLRTPQIHAALEELESAGALTVRQTGPGQVEIRLAGHYLVPDNWRKRQSGQESIP